jgi:hypothetical protein
LKQGGILPGIEVRVVVVPPAQLFPTLKLGYIDGFCGCEPWPSLAEESGAGHCVISGSQLAPLHPEKVLMTRRDFAMDRASEHERMIAALLEACAFCDVPANHRVLSDMLSQPTYVNASTECLQRGLARRSVKPEFPDSPSGSVFHQHQANDPTNSKARWIVEGLYELMEDSILPVPSIKRTPVIKNIFRRDIYERAQEVVGRETRRTAAEAAACATHNDLPSGMSDAGVPMV